LKPEVKCFTFLNKVYQHCIEKPDVLNFEKKLAGAWISPILSRQASTIESLSPDYGRRPGI
jgi:hypothetical protein